MTDVLTLAAFFFFIILFIIGLLWVLVPAMYGLPSRPTHPERIRKALQMANLKADELLYDLGSGDGRVLVMAAREFGAKAVGIEIGPVQRLVSRVAARNSGVSDRVRVEAGDFYKSDVSKADVVFIYATSTEVTKLALHLEKQMKPGSRVVSISADFPEWEPNDFDEDKLIFLYQMPPKPGSWTTYLLKK
ncbi:MAG: class I SAM-dependent methyltransferase [Anaerolineales bacterium]